MAHVKVYDPPMCCSSGVCGPEEDSTLAQFSAALDKARKAGTTVDRYSLGQQPGEYVTNTVIKSLLEAEGVNVLPVVFIDGDIVSKGGYPSRDDLFAKLGIAEGGAGAQPASAASSCCAPAEAARSGCCS